MNAVFNVQRTAQGGVLGSQYSQTATINAQALVSVATISAQLTSAAAGLSASVVCSASATGAITTSIRLNCAISANAKCTTLMAAGAILGCMLSTVTTVVTTLTNSPATKLGAVAASAVQFFAVLNSQQVTPMFIPSAARTVSVQAASPLFAAGRFWNLTDPKKPRGVKDPDATIDITFDWADWLADIGSPNISEVTFTITGASSQGTYPNGTKATVIVTGGIAGSTASVACKIKTATTPSCIDERTVYLSIEDQ